MTWCGVPGASSRACRGILALALRLEPWGPPSELFLSVNNPRYAGQVRFRWKDYARGHRIKTMVLPADEFLRRFLLHVLPAGFVRIRHFGLLENRTHTAKLARCRALLTAGPPTAPAAPEPVAALMLRLTGVDIGQCPVCRAGRLRAVAVFRPGQLPVPAPDTS
jgi:hypothetical protein